jgi:hypothetical protein
VGNKSDKSDEQAVSFQDAKDYAQLNGALFKLTSAKEGNGIKVKLVLRLGAI